MKRNVLKHGLKCLAAVATACSIAVTMGTAALAETPTRQVDADTHNSYTTALGESGSTRYNGRVWSDKTVSEDSITFSGTVDGVNKEYTYTVEPSQNEDFLVTFSTLATSTEVTHLPKIPVDVVYVLDFSASMTWGTSAQTVVDESSSRIAALVKALNESIYQLQQDNPENRIGVVYFNRIGNVWLDLQKLNGVKPDDNNNDGIPDYFSIQSFTGTQGQDNGEATVQCNFGTANGTTAKTDSKTNIQFGLNLGMHMLENATDTTFVSEGNNTYTRTPNIVLMSDGAPTTISLPVDGTSWWDALDNNDGDSVGWGDNDRPWSANGFMPMITAQYLKEKITEHYQAEAAGASNVDQAQASFYTIGFSVNQQTEDMVSLANLVLNPTDNWSSASESSNNHIKEIYTAWSELFNNQSAEVRYPTESDNDYDNGGERLSVSTQSGWVPPESPDYVDAYYEANDAGQLADAFRQIVNEITTSAQSPTEVESSDPVHDGYITYKDPIGKYMEVKNVKGLLYAGQPFTVKSTTVSEDQKTTTYHFEGTINSQVYGQQDVSEIIVTVIKNDDGTQTLQVQVPAAAIPLRVNNVTIGEDGNIQENNYNDAAYPLRLIYSVGLVDNAETLIATDEEYLKSNAAGENAVYLYSNLYSGTPYAENTSKMRGDATVTFQPAKNSPFYFIQENTELYTDSECTQHATGTLDSTQIYYFKIQYYNEKKNETAIIARQGSTLEDYTDVDSNGWLYIKEGAPRLNNLLDLAIIKDSVTEPVTDAYVLATEAARDESGDWIMTSYLGNNGRLTVTPADLKTVTDESGKDLNGQTVQIGQELTYTISYGNSMDTAQTIIITDVIPVGTEYVADSAGSNSTWNEDDRTLEWTISSVAPGATGTVTFRVKVTEDAVQPGKVENSAQIVIGNNNVATNTVTVNVQVPTPVPIPTSTPTSTPVPSDTPSESGTPTPAVTPVPTAQPTAAASESASVSGTIPQTSDSINPELWTGLMAISVAGFALLLFMRKKHQ